MKVGQLLDKQNDDFKDYAMQNLETLLHNAARSLGKCARITAGSATHLPPVEYERLIGFGIATDWLTWGRHLRGLEYASKNRADSDRAHSLTELTRFTFAWTAANALFSRDEILVLLDGTAASRHSELDRFRVLFEHSAIPAVDVSITVNKLHALLSLRMHVKHFPWPSVNNPPTILEVIYFKHMIAKEQTRGIGMKLKKAMTTGNYSELDQGLRIKLGMFQHAEQVTRFESRKPSVSPWHRARLSSPVVAG